MSVTYRNAPLVELIAEVRWNPLASAAIGVTPADLLRLGQPVLGVPRAKDEDVFQRFGALLYARGYGRSERIVPPGAMTQLGQAVCRFRPTDPSAASPMFQIGMGVLAVNAVQPYKSWTEFSPYVREGISVALEAFAGAALPAPQFNLALVRYVDAFREDLTGGRNLTSFLSEVLGIQLILPPAIKETALDPSKIEPHLVLQLPVKAGLMTITLGVGSAGSDEGILMDTTVVTQREMGANIDAAMATLSDARLTIHNVFRGLTAHLHQAMEPIQ